MSLPRRVVLESPYAGDHLDIDGNVTYAHACLLDSLRRDEAPMASHLLYTQVLRDHNQHDRALGISAGHAWIEVAEALVVYTDRGISKGMQAGIRAAHIRNVPVEFRKLNGNGEVGKFTSAA